MTDHGEENTEATLLFERQGDVATLTLNRPNARNALTTGLFLEMERIVLAIEADDGVRAVVLTRAGRSDDVREGIRAFRERRKPEFRGR